MHSSLRQNQQHCSKLSTSSCKEARVPGGQGLACRGPFRACRDIESLRKVSSYRPCRSLVSVYDVPKASILSGTDLFACMAWFLDGFSGLYQAVIDLQKGFDMGFPRILPMEPKKVG